MSANPSATLTKSVTPFATAGSIPVTDINAAYADFIAIVPEAQTMHDNDVTDMVESLQLHRNHIQTWQTQILNNTTTS
jgi:hypothetical protein